MNNFSLVWYRFSRREDDYCIECSYDGVNCSQMLRFYGASVFLLRLFKS